MYGYSSQVIFLQQHAARLGFASQGEIALPTPEMDERFVNTMRSFGVRTYGLGIHYVKACHDPRESGDF
jgi:hypothetical protein